MTNAVNELTTNSVVGKLTAAAEINVLCVQARVHNVGKSALTGAVIVDIGGRARGAVRDGTQAVRSTRLRDDGIGVPDLVSFNSSNLFSISPFPRPILCVMVNIPQGCS